MAFVDPATGELLPTLTEIRDRQQDANSAKLAEEKAAREALGNRKSVRRVNPVGKRRAKSLLAGGIDAYRSEINPTSFLPDENTDNTTQVPDFYREGRRDILFDAQGGFEVVWNPIPELISERDRPVLASIRLVDPTKVKPNNPGTSRSAQLIPEYSKFFLEGVQEAESERFQIVETFNNFYVYFFGKKPPIYQFSGHLLNTLNYNWLNEFMYFYENFWRGTRAVELGAKIFLTYNYQQVQGYILNISTDVRALTDKAAPFNFSMIVTKRLIFSGREDDGVLRDNLLPRTDTGLINTQANSFSKSLTSEFLQSEDNSAEYAQAKAENEELGVRIRKDNTQSTILQSLPNPGSISPFSTESRGAQRSGFFKRKLGLFA